MKATEEEGSVKRDGRKITSTSWICHHQTCRASHVCASRTSHAWTCRACRAWIFHHDDHNEQRRGGSDQHHGRHDELRMQLLQRQHHQRAFLLHRALNLRILGISTFIKICYHTVTGIPNLPGRFTWKNFCFNWVIVIRDITISLKIFSKLHPNASKQLWYMMTQWASLDCIESHSGGKIDPKNTSQFSMERKHNNFHNETFKNPSITI